MKICSERKLTMYLLRLLQNLSPCSSLHRTMKVAALKGHFSKVLLVFEDIIQLACEKTISWLRAREYLFMWRGAFNCLLLIIHVLLRFSLYSYYSCHWWFHFFMWLRIKEEICIDWIYSSDILIPVKFHNKVIAIGYWQPNFLLSNISLETGKTFCCWAVTRNWAVLVFYEFKQIFFQWSGCPKTSWKSFVKHDVQWR